MSLDVARVRRSFPILSRRIGENPLVYLDSAATSLTPDEVLTAEMSFYQQVRANVHRARHALSEEASDLFEGARRDIGRFINASSAEVVLTANTTAALNLVADGLDLPSDAEILTLATDHHSTLLPWRKRWAVRLIETSPVHPIDPEAVRRAIGKRTRALVVSHVSNVTGVVQPVDELCRVARENGLVSVIDAAQSVPHLPINVRSLGCDFLAFSGHKMLGPTGIGVLFGRSDVLGRLRPSGLGGGVVERVTHDVLELRPSPSCFEPGTPNIAGAIGLAAAIRFLDDLGWDAIQAHARALTGALKDGLAELRGVRLLVAAGDEVPIVSLSMPDSPVALAEFAVALSDRYGIMTRSGLLCAHPLFAAIGQLEGALRVSAYVYNSISDVTVLCESLRELMTAFG